MRGSCDSQVELDVISDAVSKSSYLSLSFINSSIDSLDKQLTAKNLKSADVVGLETVFLEQYRCLYTGIKAYILSCAGLLHNI